MTYKGTVRGRRIELETGVRLPEGLEVRIVIAEDAIQGAECRKGSPAAVLAALDRPARCTPADEDALLAAIRNGKRAVRFEGPLDAAGTDR